MGGLNQKVFLKGLAAAFTTNLKANEYIGNALTLKVFFVLLFIFLVPESKSANAKQIEFHYSGILDSVSDSLLSAFAPGDYFYGSFSIDENIIKTTPVGDGGLGQFSSRGLLSSFSFTMGGYSLSVPAGRFDAVKDGLWGAYYASIGNGGDGLNGYEELKAQQLVNGYFLTDVEVATFDWNGDAILGGELPEAYPSLELFEATFLRGAFFDGNGRYGGRFGGSFSGHLISISPTITKDVAEPGSLSVLLIVFGLLASSCRTRRLMN